MTRAPRRLTAGAVLASRRLAPCPGPALALVCLSAACTAPTTDLTAEPAAPVFTPARDDLELRIVNHTDSPLPLSRIRLDPRDPDWGAFVIEDRDLPREIAARNSVSLHLRVDREHLAGPRGGEKRQGLSHLLFQAGSAPRSIELRYQPDDPSAALRSALLRAALLVAALGLAWLVARRPRASALPWTTWLPLLALLCVLPWGLALCPSQLGGVLSQADLEQCAERRGGEPLVLLAAAEGWLVYLLALVVAALGRLAHAARDLPRAAAEARLASRDLALALAFAGPLLSFGTLDPSSLAASQTGPLVAAISWLPRWACFVQPLAAAVAIAVAAAPHTTGTARIHVAAAIAAIFFGGATLPASLTTATPHGLALVAAGVALAVKIAALAWLLRLLAAAPAGSRARAGLVLLERASVPLLLVNLLMTSAYGLWR